MAVAGYFYCGSYSPDCLSGTPRPVDGVAKVDAREAQDGIASFDIRSHNDKDLREAISQRVAQNGWTIRQLDLRRRTLEDLFAGAVLGVQESEG